jgi:hypothetical protein
LTVDVKGMSITALFLKLSQVFLSRPMVGHNRHSVVLGFGTWAIALVPMASNNRINYTGSVSSLNDPSNS